MSSQFIHPNWHPMLVHAPLALLGVGILLEIVTVLWRKGDARKAGRWMIFLGALLSLPAATCGIYAIRDVITPSPADSDTVWSEIRKSSDWSSAQWEYMFLHLRLAAIGAGISALAATIWAGASDRWRRRLYLPALVAILAAMGLMSVAGYYSGESVYTHGTAVRLAPPGREDEADAPHRSHARVMMEFYAPPLQAHVTLAGFVLAFALGATATTMRRWSYEEAKPSPTIDAAERSIYDAVASAGGELPPIDVEFPQRVKIFPSRFWMITFLCAALAATAGVWTSNDLDLSEIRRMISSAQSRADSPRLLLHIILGTSIVITSLLLGTMTLLFRKWRKITGILTLFLLLAISAQIYIGALMTFDSMSGSLLHVNQPMNAATTTDSDSHR